MLVLHFISLFWRLLVCMKNKINSKFHWLIILIRTKTIQSHCGQVLRRESFFSSHFSFPATLCACPLRVLAPLWISWDWSTRRTVRYWPGQQEPAGTLHTSRRIRRDTDRETTHRFNTAGWTSWATPTHKVQSTTFVKLFFFLWLIAWLIYPVSILVNLKMKKQTECHNEMNWLNSEVSTVVTNGLFAWWCQAE